MLLLSMGSAMALSAAAQSGASSTAGSSDLQAKTLADSSCAACHGADGNSVSPRIPKLAGQTESYLRSQLFAFRSGARKSDVMSGPAHALSDSQIAELARFYSRQAVKPDTVSDLDLARAGARIYRYSTRGAPPCAACHDQGRSGRTGPMTGGGMMGGGMMGGGMMGNSANAPNLNGQHAAYILQQLNAFADGTRRGTVMGDIAARLTERDRKAVAEYLAGLR